ncbi:MAG TPA: sugar phosphate nucleotidyltransferase, partial [Sedimentisphaerales bacterium]|nr:sugar phosphate nucleotidyltransferase [Sedimentisphaerales bacterium]
MSERSWAAALIKRNSRIIDAIHNINGSCLQIALVVDEDNVLLGTITDGDIRRGLLCGIGIDECVENVMNTSPIVAPPTMCRDLVRHMMQMNCLLQLPVVDERRRVIGLHLWNSVISSPDRSNLMVIMAGGKGTRLRPYTEDCPKPMLPIAGKPILEHILAQAKEDGFRNFVISVHYLSHIIEEYFGSGEKWGVRISYLHEDHPLGT